MYLITSYYQSPIAITYPRPVGYALTLKEAKQIVADRNKRSVRNLYGFVKLKQLKVDV